MEYDPQCLNWARRKVNREVCRAMHQGLGSVIGHLDIRLEMPGLYRGDGICLSDQGMEIFLTDLQWGLRAEVFGLMREMEHS